MTHLGICSCNEAFIKYFEIIFYKCIKKKKKHCIYIKILKLKKILYYHFSNLKIGDYKFFIIFDIFN